MELSDLEQIQGAGLIAEAERHDLVMQLAQQEGKSSFQELDFRSMSISGAGFQEHVYFRGWSSEACLFGGWVSGACLFQGLLLRSWVLVAVHVYKRPRLHIFLQSDMCC